jgi:hypothetical protein
VGTILYTPGGVGLYDHEGYVSHVLKDGTSARGTWTTDVEADTVAWRAECTCGWAGALHDSGGPDSPSDDRCDQILRDWEIAHAGPLLRARERAFHLEALAEAVANAEAVLRQAAHEAHAAGLAHEEIARVLRMNVAMVERLSDKDPGSAATPTSGGTPEWELPDGPIAI